MKKIVALVGVVLFSAPAFALNAVEPAENDCEAARTAFEQRVSSLPKDSFIVQYILINLADPVKEWTDEQFAPLAQCYHTYHVKGTTMVNFVRKNADIFRKEVLGSKDVVTAAQETYDNLQAELLDFADRVESLGTKAGFEEVVAQGNDREIMWYIFDNMVNPLSQMPQKQAAAKAQEYKDYKVKGKPLSEFVREQASLFDMNAEIKLEIFADWIDSK